MKSLVSFLCCRCAELLKGNYVEVTPVFGFYGEANECPWCQKKKIGSYYQLDIGKKL